MPAENRDARERDRQALRLRRYGMAAATSLMVIALLWISYWFGDLTWRGVTHGTALILFWVALFYVLLRSGINLRLPDPSMTVPQVSASIVTMAYIMYFADRGRGALVVIFLVSCLFAVFRLRTRQLLYLAALAAASYSVMVACLYWLKPDRINGGEEILKLIVVLVTLPWFAVMGGYVSRLRDEMRDANRKLETRERGGGGGGARQERVPGEHEPRDPHADERRHRHDRPAARHAADRRAARVRRDHPRQRRRAARRSSTTSSTSRRSRRAGSISIRIRSICASCIEDALDLVAAAAHAKHLDLSYHVDPAIPVVLVTDVTRLRQIVVNLLSNAVKFTEAGEVSVHVSLPRPVGGDGSVDVQFAVEDTGIGIPADRRDRLFQAFSQVDASTTRRYGGTGLGLAIARRLVELLGGRIGVESKPGKGSRFTFTIRATAGTLPEEPASAAWRAGPGQPSQLDRAQRADRRRPLVDAPLSRAARAGLGHGLVEPPRRPMKRWRWIDEGRRYDVVLVDTHLTGTSAATLASRVRQTLGPAAPALVALTALGRRDEETAALFSATVTKPIKASRLFDALADLLIRGEPRRDAAPAAPGEPTLADRHPLRILVAEDNGVNQRVVLAMLRRLGYRADLAANGREAVDAVRQRPYDVVLMDLHMPELDGLGALRQIHAEHAPDRRPRVIALTANALEEDRQECLAAGMDDYLSKPLQRDKLEAALERAGADLGGLASLGIGQGLGPAEPPSSRPLPDPSEASLYLAFPVRAHLFEAARADAMAELRVAAVGDVGFDLLPVVLVAADALAVAADRQHAAQLFDARERLLQFRDALRQPLLQRQHADAGVDPRAQLRGAERLDQVVVGAGVEARDHVFGGVAAGQKDHVHRGAGGIAADAAAQFRAVEARHLPVHDRQRRRVVGRDDLPRGRAVLHDNRLDGPAREGA